MVAGAFEPGPALGAPEPAERAAILKFWEDFNAGTALRMKKDFPGAERRYLDALAIDPKHEDSLYYLGQSRQEMANYKGAREAFEKLVALNPESARGYLALGALLATPDETAPLDLDAGEKAFRRAHEINGEETGPVVRIGEIEIVRGHFDEATRWLEGAMRTNPKSVEAAFFCGYLRWRKGDVKTAADFYRLAQKAARGDAPIKGVMSEGDRRAAPPVGQPSAAAPGSAAAAGGAPASAPAHVVAPPLKSPLGKTIFSRFCEPVREAAEKPGEVRVSVAVLDAAYAPMREAARRFASRAGVHISP
jgi:tetratricopeptide (TPR) repeat protein